MPSDFTTQMRIHARREFSMTSMTSCHPPPFEMQPQSSMKESHPAKLHLQEVAPTGTASSTSNKSTSLQLLLLLHTAVGVAALRRRNGCSCTARAPCASQPPMQQWHAGGRWPCHSHGRGRGSRRGERGRLHPSEHETFDRTLYDAICRRTAAVHFGLDNDFSGIATWGDGWNER